MILPHVQDMSAWDRWDVPVKLQEEPLDLGKVSMPRIGLSGSIGSSLWDPARSHASNQLELTPDNFSIASLSTASGNSMTMDEASCVPLMELKQMGAEVILSLPEGSTPTWKIRQDNLEAMVKQQAVELKQQAVELKKQAVELKQMAVELKSTSKRTCRLAMRALLDAARRWTSFGRGQTSLGCEDRCHGQ